MASQTNAGSLNICGFDNKEKHIMMLIIDETIVYNHGQITSARNKDSLAC